MRVGEIHRVTITADLETRVLVRAGDGFEGFVSCVEFSWDQNAREFPWLFVGAELDVRVLVVRDEGFSASFRQAHPEDDPWIFANDLSVGDRVHGVVGAVMSWGATVTLAPAVYAVCVLSEGESATTGEAGEFRIVRIDRPYRAIELRKA
jgi:ribosomal protein S1